MLAGVTTALAVLVGGLVGPAVLTAVAVVMPALIGRILGRLLRTALLLTLPIAISVLVVNLFFFPAGRDVLFRLGPITATAEGLGFALETLARIGAISGAITLFYLTTPPSELVLDPRQAARQILDLGTARHVGGGQRTGHHRADRLRRSHRRRRRAVHPPG